MNQILWKRLSWIPASNEPKRKELIDIKEFEFILNKFVPGIAVKNVIPLAQGLNSSNYKVSTLDGQSYFLKAHTTINAFSEIDAINKIYELLNNTSINTPKKITTDNGITFLHKNNLWECFEWLTLDSVQGLSSAEFKLLGKELASIHLTLNSNGVYRKVPSEVFWKENLNPDNLRRALFSFYHQYPKESNYGVICEMLIDIAKELSKLKTDTKDFFIHGDLHMGNIFVDANDKSKIIILDFGAARVKKGGQSFDIGMAFYRMIRNSIMNNDVISINDTDTIKKMWKEFMDGYNSINRCEINIQSALVETAKESIQKIEGIIANKDFRASKNFNESFAYNHLIHICEVACLCEVFDINIKSLRRLNNYVLNNDVEFYQDNSTYRNKNHSPKTVLDIDKGKTTCKEYMCI